ncbi:Protein nedd1 [Bulinus truncatus]|nr:Protein nedd1 [Bulinus truncatus]
MITLASSGDEAKIWDIPTFSLLEQFNSHDGTVTDLTWSHDGNVIATCCISEKTVHIRSTKTSNSVITDNFTLPSGSMCMDFNSTSRFLLCGCEDGSFHIWDRKTQTVKKSSSNQKNPITVARWNWNDSYVALGLETGKIILYNVVTSQTNSPMNTSSNQAIRQMKYNPYRKSALVTVADDGIVNFWDTNTRRLMHSFSNTHQAPAKDLAFSPINDYLMVTVGLDKRAVFYDVQNKSSVKTIIADQPLTSVDMMPDGATVAVGTSRGNIFLYDMRQSASPVFTLAAHKSSVKKLSFIKKEGVKNESPNIHRQLPSTPLLSNEATYQNAFGNSNHLTGVNVFSPLREVNKSNNNSLVDKSSTDRSWLYKSGAADTTDAGLGIFSPLRHDNSQSVNSIRGTSSLLANNSFLNKILSPSVNTAERSRELDNNVHNSLNAFFKNASSSQAPVTDTLSSNLLYEGEEKSADLLNGDPLNHLLIGPSASPTSFQHASSSSPVENVVSSHIPGPMNKSTPHRQTRVSIEDKARDEGSSPRSAVTGDIGFPISPRDIIQRSEERKSPPASSNKSATLSNLQQSSLRHLVQDLLREQFQEHHEHLKSEIRTMLGQTSESEQTKSITPTRPDNPEIYRAEFIRNLIREELYDLKDFIHKEFWAVQVEVIKQAFQLQRYMEAGFNECLINPILLDEIDRLREENSRLRKTF